jgi:hypothetical protein
MGRKPELLTSGPCDLWSWDITMLKGAGHNACKFRDWEVFAPGDTNVFTRPR